MKVELDGPAESDLEVRKSVQANDEIEALNQARQLVRMENPEITVAKIWAWSIERTPSAFGTQL
jgi:hypothetical protein